MWREKYLHGLDELGRLDFHVVEGELTRAAVHEGYRAGSARERVSELEGLFRDPRVHGVIAVIGGSVSNGMLPWLDYELIRAHPKVLCGYSDVTALHCAVMRHAGLGTFYGPAVASSFGEWPHVPDETRDSFLEAVRDHRSGPRRLEPFTRFSRERRGVVSETWKQGTRRYEAARPWRSLRPGTARGPSLVANLNTLMALAGTPDFPDSAGCVLFVEEMEVSLAAQERKWVQLARMGVLREVAALVVSRPEIVAAEDSPRHYDAIVLEALEGCDVPVVVDFDCSHTIPMRTMPQGVPVQIEASRDAVGVTLLEPAVS